MNVYYGNEAIFFYAGVCVAEEFFSKRDSDTKRVLSAPHASPLQN